MCSCRTCVPMIACLSIPGFDLKAALRARPSLELRPAALAPEPGAEPLIRPVTAAAEALGVRLQMRLRAAPPAGPPHRPRHPAPPSGPAPSDEQLRPR